MIGVKYKICVVIVCKTGFFDDFCYFWLTLVSENKYTRQNKRKKRKKKEMYTVWLVNYSHLRIVNKIIIFEQNCLNFLSVIDKYLGLQYCMQNVLFFNCMFLT